MQRRSAFSRFLLRCNAGVLGLTALAGQVLAQACVTPPAGIVSWWPGDGNANDISDGNNGTTSGTVTFASGFVGKAFVFDGSAASVTAGNAANLQLSSGDFTVEGWVYYNSLFGSDSVTCDPAAGCDMSIADKMFSPALALYNLDGWRLLKQAHNYFLFCFGGGSGNGCGNNNPTSVSTQVGSVVAQTWYHVAAVKSGTTIALYVNGVWAAQNALGPFTDTSTANLIIGAGNGVASGGGAFSNGLVDELTLYNRALSPSELQGIFAAGSSGKCKFTPVSIAIKPGSATPPINLRSAGSIPVAILSTSTFDATQINSATVTLAGASVQLLGNTGVNACSVQDVNGDLLPDLVCHIRTQQMLIQPGETILVLEGRTFSGQAIRGQQSVRIVP